MFIFLGADRVRLVDREPKIAILLEITPCWVSPAFVPADIAAPMGPKTLIAAILLQTCVSLTVSGQVYNSSSLKQSFV